MPIQQHRSPKAFSDQCLNAVIPVTSCRSESDSVTPTSICMALRTREFELPKTVDVVQTEQEAKRKEFDAKQVHRGSTGLIARAGMRRSVLSNVKLDSQEEGSEIECQPSPCKKVKMCE
eukprot:1588250-Amphidinium_carterae.1